MEDFENIDDLKNDSAPPFAFDKMNNFPNSIYKDKNEIISNNKNIINENDDQINDEYLYIKLPLNKINKNHTRLKIDIDQKYLNELEKENLKEKRWKNSRRKYFKSEKGRKKPDKRKQYNKWNKIK